MPWTAADIPDQTGRAAVVTGANSGIGYHTARVARRGARVVLALELQRRADAAGADLRSVAAHPGYAATNLQAGTTNRVEAGAMAVLNRLVAQPESQGALPTLRAATDPEARGGDVFGPSGPFELRGLPKLVTVANRARDRAVARRLWETSERLTGVRYEALDPPS